MKNIFYIFAFVVGISHYAVAAGDTTYPEVGKPCPDFVLRNIEYYPKKEATLSDFKGKWLVLDFWDKYCGSCIESFPKTSAMQKMFGDRVQFMLVGIQDKENQIELMYTKFRERENLLMPCAFDSAITNHWGIYNCPHIIIIDDKGVVQGVTFRLDSGDIKEFLKGGHPTLGRTYYTEYGDDIRDGKIPFDGKNPFLINGNGSEHDTDFLYRSVLAKWNPTNEELYIPVSINLYSINPKYREGIFQVLGMTLLGLYLYAYFGSPGGWDIYDTAWYGKYCDKPILDIKDSSQFQWSAVTGKNVFSYSLIIPPDEGTTERLEEIMQRDLKNYFGFDCSVEVRNIPIWRLVATKEAKVRLKTHGGPVIDKYIIPRFSFTLQNAPVKRLIQRIAGPVHGIIINETGIEGNIDITIKNQFDLDDMKKSLRENGLDLLPGEKEMKVLVIRDEKKEE